MSKLTAANRKRFLEAYTKCGVIGEAARRAKVSRMTHYLWLEDPDYRQQFEAAHESACDLLEAECRRRAVEGVDEPVIYQGELCYKLNKSGTRSNIPLTIRRHSDVLLIFLLKAARPEKYRDNWKGEIKHTGEINNKTGLENLTDEELQQIESIFLAASNRSAPQQLEQLHSLAESAVNGNNGHTEP